MWKKIGIKNLCGSPRYAFITLSCTSFDGIKRIRCHFVIFHSLTRISDVTFRAIKITVAFAVGSRHIATGK